MEAKIFRHTNSKFSNRKGEEKRYFSYNIRIPSQLVKESGIYLTESNTTPVEISYDVETKSFLLRIVHG